MNVYVKPSETFQVLDLGGGNGVEVLRGWSLGRP